MALVVGLPKKLRPGTHRIKVDSTPADQVRYAPSSTTIKLIVRT